MLYEKYLLLNFAFFLCSQVIDEDEGRMHPENLATFKNSSARRPAIPSRSLLASPLINYDEEDAMDTSRMHDPNT